MRHDRISAILLAFGWKGNRSKKRNVIFDMTCAAAAEVSQAISRNSQFESKKLSTLNDFFAIKM